MLRLQIAAQCLGRLFAGKDDRNWSQQYFDFPVTEAIACLREEVYPAIDKIWNRPSFRNLVLLAHQTLLADKTSPERTILDEIKKQLCASVAELQTEIEQQFPSVNGRIEGGPNVACVQLLDELRRSTNDLAVRGAEEWASVENFFEPHRIVHKPARGLFEGRIIQRREHIGFGKRQLPEFGNLIARAALMQIEYIIEEMRKASHKFRSTFRIGFLRSNLPWLVHLNQARKLLEELRVLAITSDNARIAESAIILCQIYAGIAPSEPDLTWLGLTRKSFRPFSSHVLGILAYVRHYQTGNRIVLALSDLAQYYERRPPNESALEEAIATGGLVVDEIDQRVYWEKTLVDVDWTRFRKPWEFLLLLAKTRGRGSVAEQDVYGQPMAESTFPNLRLNLGELLPDSLNVRIESGELKSYQIHLPFDQFHLFLAERLPEAVEA